MHIKSQAFLSLKAGARGFDVKIRFAFKCLLKYFQLNYILRSLQEVFGVL